MGAGLGLGIGVPLGQMASNQMGQVGIQTDMSRTQQQAFVNPSTPSNSTPSQGANTQGADPMQKLKLLQDLANLKAQGILTEEEFQSEKRKILSS